MECTTSAGKIAPIQVEQFKKKSKILKLFGFQGGKNYEIFCESQGRKILLHEFFRDKSVVE